MTVITFGKFFKDKRLRLGKTLRQFCLENSLDPGNISKIERDLMPPPISNLNEYAQYLELDEDELKDFEDLAHAFAGKIPDDLKDEETLARLPIFFRTLRGKDFSEEKLKELARKIAQS